MQDIGSKTAANFNTKQLTGTLGDSATKEFEPMTPSILNNNSENGFYRV